MNYIKYLSWGNLTEKRDRVQFWELTILYFLQLLLVIIYIDIVSKQTIFSLVLPLGKDQFQFQ